MRKLSILAAFAVLLTACSEKIEVQTRNMDRICLVVDGMLTDEPDHLQTVRLTESIDYDSQETPPAVSGARVTISDGAETVLLTESPSGSGCYVAPAGYHGETGKQYTLSVEASVGGKPHVCQAVASMPEMGFEVEAVDYMYAGDTSLQLDSLA